MPQARTPRKTLTPLEALEWTKNSLIEMPEYAGEPAFVRYETELTQHMIEFLADRVMSEGLKTNLGHLDLMPGDTVRDFIKQLDTDGRF